MTKNSRSKNEVSAEISRSPVLLPSGTSGSNRRRFWLIALGFVLFALVFNSDQEKFTEIRSHAKDVLGNFDMDLLKSFTESQANAIIKTVSEFSLFPIIEPFIPHSKQKLYPKHPVVIIPGFITSGLEIWDGKPCVEASFRQRIWGSASMIQHMLRDPQCWLEHMRLDESGLDPPGIRLRPVNGLESGDYFLGKFWVWSQVIEVLGKIGYDSNSLFLMSYDWRLHLADMEVRDRYFTRLAHTIEGLVSSSREKVLLLTHSYGALVLNFFIHWVEHHRYSGWLNDHLEYVYSLSGAFLGVPKAVGALIGGDMRDTNLGTFSPLMEMVMNHTQRATLWRSWGSLYTMIPKSSLDGTSHVSSQGEAVVYYQGKSLNVTEAVQLLIDLDPIAAPNLAKVDALSEPIYDDELICPSESIASSCYRKSWTSPLSSPLPSMPPIMCVYGSGIPTEIAYHFVGNPPKLDTSVQGPMTDDGIELGDGDGSVGIDSLRRMCAESWIRGTRLNPHGVVVTSREIPQTAVRDNGLKRLVLGADGSKLTSSHHVDILGHHSVLSDVVALAAGRKDLLMKE